MLSQIIFFLCLYNTVSAPNKIDHCTTIHIMPEDKPDEIIENVYNCFLYSNDAVTVPKEYIVASFKDRAANIINAMALYDKEETRIANQDLDSKRDLRDIQQQIVKLYFTLHSVIHQVELPHLRHATIDHIFFKVGAFLNNTRKTSTWVKNSKKTIDNFIQQIETLKSDAGSLEQLREQRMQAENQWDATIEQFRSSLRAKYDAELSQ